MDEKQLSKLIRLAEEGDMYLQEQIDETAKKLDSLENKPEFSVDAQVEKVAMKLATKLAVMEKGDKGDTPSEEELLALIQPLIPDVQNGKDYVLTEKDKRQIARSIEVPVVERTTIETIREQPIITEITKITNEIKEVAIAETPDEVIQKINKSRLLINKDRIDGLVDALSQMVHSAVGITTTIFFKNGAQVGRAKNINFLGTAVSSVTVVGDTAQVSLSGGSGGGQVNSVVAGTGISVDSTDPANPIVTNTGSSPNFADNEVVSGLGTTYTLAHTPVSSSQHIYGAGVRLTNTVDYTISSAVITITNGSYATGEVLADYRY